MKKKWQDLSVLIVGCGSIGIRHIEVLYSLEVKNISIFDNDNEKINILLKKFPKLKAYKSFEEGLIEKPDTVFILTPTKMHIAMIIKALKAGCHVFTEKPLSDSMDRSDELLRVMDQTRKKVMVGHCFRYHKGLLKVKKLIGAEHIGRLVSIRALMGEHLPLIRPDYKNMYLAKYSGAFELMHDIDLAIWYADKPIKKVKALYGTYSDIGVTSPDTVEILIDFENKCMANIHLDFFQIPRRRHIELMGTNGVIIVEFGSWDEYTVSVYRKEIGKWEITKGVTKRNDMFMDEDKEFLVAVAEDKPMLCDVPEALKVVQVIESSKNLPA